MTRVKLVHAQDFVDALRQGEFYKVANIIKFIGEKYYPILDKTIGADENLPCLIYELTLTDVNEDDLVILATLIASFAPFDLQENKYAFTNLISAMQIALCMKLVDEVQKIPTSQEELKDLILNRKSIFNQLVNKVTSLIPKYNEEVDTEPRDEQIVTEEVSLEIKTKIKEIFEQSNWLTGLDPENLTFKQCISKYPIIPKYIKSIKKEYKKVKLLLEHTNNYMKDLSSEINFLVTKFSLTQYGTGPGANIGLLIKDLNKLNGYPALQKEVFQFINANNFLKKIDTMSSCAHPLDTINYFTAGYRVLKRTAMPTPAWKTFAVKVGAVLRCFDSIGLVKQVVSWNLFQKSSQEKFEGRVSQILKAPHIRCC